MYEHREFEKMLKKCDALIDKNPTNIDAYYYRALCLWEMAQMPEQYVQVSDNPLEQYLQSLAKVRKNDDDGSFMKEHKDTIKLMRRFAEEAAKETVKTNKTKAIRIYKLIYKIATDDLNSLTVAEIYLKADDINSAFFEVDNLYGYDKSNGTDQALFDAPVFMMKHWMFKDLFIIAEKYKNKYPIETPIGQAFYKGIKESLDTMYDYKDKNMFFDYSKKAIKLYPENADLRTFLVKKFMSLMKKTVQEYDKITTQKTWRDTIILRDVFKFTDLANRIIPDSQFVQFEKRIESKYLISIPYSRIKMFQDICQDVMNSVRQKNCKCRDKEFYAVDTVAWNETLEIVAREHAKEMFAYNYTEHTNQEGLGPKERVDQTDLKAYKLNTLSGVMFTGAVKVEECISTGYSMKDVQTALDLKEQVQKVVEKWMNSKDGDCENIMNYEFTHFGIGAFGDRWVLMLAKVMFIQDK